MVDHPVFARFAPFRESETNWLGSSFPIEPKWLVGHPICDNELFEWISLFQSVLRARDRFTMLELGAGIGRWGAWGALAAKAVGIEDISVRLVEAEPQHAAWARDTIRLNHLEETVELIEAVLSDRAGYVPFTVVELSGAADYVPESWFGQTASHTPQFLQPTGERYHGQPIYRGEDRFGYIQAKTISLEAVMADLGPIDLIDADIQGAESEFPAKIDLLTDRVRFINIATHTAAIEADLRRAFSDAGWICQWDFGLQDTHETPYGPLFFGDGVQAWLNPAL